MVLFAVEKNMAMQNLLKKTLLKFDLLLEIERHKRSQISMESLDKMLTTFLPRELGHGCDITIAPAHPNQYFQFGTCTEYTLGQDSLR